MKHHIYDAKGRPVKHMTICFLLKKSDQGVLVCLARKKRGFRVGKLNGYGGKQEPGETLRDCAIRETREESLVNPLHIKKVAQVCYYDHDAIYDCHVYLSLEWEGEPVETEEMLPDWYSVAKMPLEHMGKTDHIWLPNVLGGKCVVCEFHFTKENGLFKQKVDWVDSVDE